MSSSIASSLDPGIARRQSLLTQFEAGEITEDELPRDVLMVLLRNQDKIELSRESIRREIAFYLLAGAHTSATAFTRCMHYIFKWLDEHPDDADRVRNDRVFVQRMHPRDHSTPRVLANQSTMGTRRSRTHLWHQDRKGDRVTIDLNQVNRSTEVYGADAEDFNPDRVLDDGVTPWGLSFGQGMHACIGLDLAADWSSTPRRPKMTISSGLSQSRCRPCLIMVVAGIPRIRRRWTSRRPGRTSASTRSSSTAEVTRHECRPGR